MSNVIDAVFKLTDEFSQPFKNCISSLTDAGRAGKNARKQLESTGKAITSVGASLTATITAPAVAAGTAAVTNYASVDKTLRLVQATMGSTNEEAQALSDAIGEAAANSVYTMQDAADATLNFARQGFSAAESADMITSALSLSAGTETDLSTVTAGLGNAIKMFGLDSSDAANAADVLAKAQAQANTTVTDLFEAMSTAGPICNTVGWSLNDLATITDVFGDAGISGSEGATALKTGLAKLASPASDGAAWIEKLNLELFNSDGTMKSFVETQEQLHDAFEGLTSEEQMQAASALFGKNQMAKWLTLIQSAPEDVQSLESALDDCSGTSQNMADALLSGTGGSIEKLKSSIDVLGYSIGEILSEYVQPVVDKITEIVDSFRNMDSEQQKQTVKWVAVAAAVGPCLIAFGKMVTFSSKLFGAFSKLKTAGGLVKGALAALSAPTAVVVAALAGIVAIIAIVVTHLDQFKTVFSNALSDCAPLIESIQSKFSSMGEALSPIITTLSDLIASGLAGAFQYLVEGAIMVADGITTALSGIVDIITGVINAVVALCSGDWTTAWESMGTVVDGVMETIIGLIESVIGVVGGIVSAVGGAVEGVKNFVTGGGNSEETGKNASGTNNWRGGLTSVNEQGGELINLPSGSQIIPHDLSRNLLASGSGQTVNISGNSFTIREEADIDKITDSLVRKLYKAQANMGMA